MADIFVLVLFVAVLVHDVAVGEIFTSVAKMKTLPEIELKLIKECNIFISRNANEPGLQNIKQFLHRAEIDNEKSLRDLAYLENPVNGFRFLWRLADGWHKAIKGPFSSSLTAKVQRFLLKVRNAITSLVTWPTHEDIIGSAVAITKLVHTYALNPEDVAQGRLLDTQTEAMTGSELLILGEETLNHVNTHDSYMWLNQSIRMLNALRNDRKTLLDAHNKLQEVSDKIQKEKENGFHQSEDILFSVDVTTVEGAPSSFGFYQSEYEELCRRDLKTPRAMARLSCWFKQVAHPFHKVKVELLNSDPVILVFHDVISDQEAETMKNISFKLLNRSTVVKKDGSGHEGMRERISQSAWIFDDESNVALRLSRRIEQITGLSTIYKQSNTHAEPFQVLNYGLGGVYDPHEDSVRIFRQYGYEQSSSVRNSGDRTATWLYYLSDVTSGGATVFPILRTRIPVTKGSAAFWYNLKRNGEADIRTVHAGCPVLVGDKWVANKWIREVGQIFRRPCSLKPND